MRFQQKVDKYNTDIETFFPWTIMDRKNKGFGIERDKVANFCHSFFCMSPAKCCTRIAPLHVIFWEKIATLNVVMKGFISR